MLLLDTFEVSNVRGRAVDVSEKYGGRGKDVIDIKYQFDDVTFHLPHLICIYYITI